MGERRSAAPAVVELLRLLIVVLTTAAGWLLAEPLVENTGLEDLEQVRFLGALFGALGGYVIGGLLGRGFVRGVDKAEQRLNTVEAPVLIAGLVGGAASGVAALLILWPVLLLPFQQVTIPAAMLVLIVVAYTGGRIGAARAGDLQRFVGVRGRLEVSSPSRGAGVKLVDTSALIDGRLVELARAGFLEGTLVVPEFVLYELQGLADNEDKRRRDAGRRGMDLLQTLQHDGLVAVEVTEDDVADRVEVDAKLVELARRRSGSLITVDANLARVAELSSVRVLNLHRLAEALRPPVVPGTRVQVNILREGTEVGQGVGYLDDGSMVVVERAGEDLGGVVAADVTSISQNRNGRMLFATKVEA